MNASGAQTRPTRHNVWTRSSLGMARTLMILAERPTNLTAFRPQAIEEIHLVHAIMLNLNEATRLQLEECLDLSCRAFRDIDSPR